MNISNVNQQPNFTSKATVIGGKWRNLSDGLNVISHNTVAKDWEIAQTKGRVGLLLSAQHALLDFGGGRLEGCSVKNLPVVLTYDDARKYKNAKGFARKNRFLNDILAGFVNFPDKLTTKKISDINTATTGKSEFIF